MTDSYILRCGFVELPRLHYKVVLMSRSTLLCKISSEVEHIEQTLNDVRAIYLAMQNPARFRNAAVETWQQNGNLKYARIN